MRRPAGIAMIVVVAVAACGGAGVSPTPTTTPTSATTAGASLSAASDPASPSTAPTPAPTATGAPIPLAEIVTADASIAGHIGSYDIDGRGSDSPALPFDTLPAVAVGTADVLTLQFVDHVAIGDRQIVITGATDMNGASPQAVYGVALAADGLSLQIGPLPPGRWVLEAWLYRADSRGDGITFWAVTVG